MIIFPAIDLKDGVCVRLQKGEMDKATVFNESPANQALAFKQQGFTWIHIVDLNAAFEGKSVNSKAVNEIIKAVGDSVFLQLGGGIRSMEAIDGWLNAGVKRVILGTAALNNPELVKEACAKYPGRIVVGIDAKAGKVAVDGWANTSEISVIELARKFENAGVAAIIYTDINRDGILTGPDIEGTKKLAEAVSIPVIASGGVSSVEDLKSIKAIESSGIVGVITGRALYEGKIDVEKALNIA